MADVIMPKMGDAMDEGKIVQWLKKVGDKVAADEAIAEIETDKSNVEVPAEEAGYIQQITRQAGDVVPVGQVIAVIGATPPSGDAPAAAAPTAPATAASSPAVNNNGATAAAVVPTPAAPIAMPATAVPATVSAATATDFKPYESFVGAMPENLGGSASVIGAPVVVDGETTTETGDERVRATPLAKAIAQANNVDLTALRGTGPIGAVGKADVEAALVNGTSAAKAAPTAAATPAPATEPDEVVEYNAMRRTIAKRLAESKQTIPHFYVTAEIDMEALLALREQVNAGAGEGGLKLSINDFLVKAVAVALTEHPIVNSQFVDNKRIVKKAINIGVAVSIADGLIVPVLRGCESKSIRAIAREARPLFEKARAGKLTPADYTGGTFTISNMGALTPDIEDFSAIVNPGEGAILAVASTRTVPAVVGGQIVPRKRMRVTLSVDHRTMDGSDGGLFVSTLKRIIENPLQILV